MIILCNGHAKSGSSFVYQITEGMVEDLGFDQIKIREKYVPNRYVPYKPHPHFVELPEGSMTDLVDVLPEEILMVLKTHNPLTKEIEALLEDKRILALFSYRNPRDAAVSLRDSARREEHLEKKLRRFYGINSNEDAIRVIADRWSLSIPWLENKNTLSINYDSILLFPFELSAHIKEYLGIDVDADKVLINYLTERNKIREYNIGVSNRHVSNFSVEEESLCDELLADFEARYFNNVEKKDVLWGS